MKPAPFAYHAPTSEAEALSLLESASGDAKLLAGGQSLVPAMNFRIMQPSVIIDLNAIKSLSYIKKAEEGGLHIGAMTRQSTVERDLDVKAKVPLLHLAMPLIAHRQIRNRGTIGGSLVHADPAAELPVVAFLLGAKMTIAGNGGERTVAADDFFQGMFTTDVGDTELLKSVHFPATAPRTGFSFLEVARRSGDYAMAGVASMIRLADEGDCREAKLVYLNVGDGPCPAPQAAALLENEPRSQELFRAAADKAAAEEIFPFGNVHATPEYQRHLAKVLTERALHEAWDRALAAGLQERD
jgi:carbon-monoxide dehydrogenase medium subunit